MLIETLINLKMAELDALAALLKRSPRSVRARALARPDRWVERLVELANLHDLAGHLEGDYRRLASVPRRVRRAG